MNVLCCLLTASLALGLAGCRSQVASTQSGSTQSSTDQTASTPSGAAQSNTDQTSNAPSGSQQTAASTAQAAPDQTTPATTHSEAGARQLNEANTIEIVKRYEPGLVYISTSEQSVGSPLGDVFGNPGQGQPQEQQTGVGSGFFVNSAGDILTNFHVVRGASGIKVRLLGGSATYTARVIGTAPQYDLALIRPTGLPASRVRPIPLGNSDTLEVGQKTIAMGAPFGLDFSVSEGIVSAKDRRIPIGFSNGGEGISQKAIQTDAAINPGNSGGPLLDSTGRVIGINTQIISPLAQSGAGQSAGVGFAIPINSAKNLLPRLLAAKGGEVRAPIIGIQAGLVAAQQGSDGQVVAVPVGLSLLRPEARQELNLPANGLVVGRVTPGSPAAKAGLRGGTSTRDFQGGQVSLGGDVITKVNGENVDSLEDLQSYLIDKKLGDRLTLTLVRGGQTRTATITLDASSFAPQQ